MNILAADSVDAKKIYTQAWEFFKANWKLVYKAGLLFGVLTYVPQFTLDAILSALQASEQDFLVAIVGLVVQVWQTIIGMGAIIVFLDIIRNKHAAVVNLEVFFSQTSRFWLYILASLRYTIIILIGFLLLIIPGIIWSIKYQFVFYLLVDKKLGVKEAFDVSAQMTEGIKWKIFVFGLFGFLIVIAGLLLLGVGLFIAFPVVTIASYMLYDRLLSRTKFGITQEAIVGEIA